MAYIGIKGQTTVEFMVVFMLVLTFIHLITNPAINFTGDIALDVKDGLQIKLESQKLSDAINAVAMSGENAKKSVWIFIPLSSTLSCDDTANKINYAFNLRRNSNKCTNKLCEGGIDLLEGITLNCNFGVTGQIDGLSTPQALMGVIKNGGEVSVWRVK